MDIPINTLKIIENILKDEGSTYAKLCVLQIKDCLKAEIQTDVASKNVN